jgi:DnaJ-domain-containing protein 1
MTGEKPQKTFDLYEVGEERDRLSAYLAALDALSKRAKARARRIKRRISKTLKKYPPSDCRDSDSSGTMTGSSRI